MKSRQWDRKISPWILALLWAVSATAAPENKPFAPSQPESATMTSLDGSERIGELSRKVRALLKARQKTERTEPVLFRFDRLAKNVWPQIAIQELRQKGTEWVVRFSGDPNDYAVGQVVKGARIVAIAPEGVALELNGERKVFPSPKVFPGIVLRNITKVEGEWVTFLDQARKPYCVGDIYQGAKILGITERTVTFEFGGQQKTLSLNEQKASFPELSISGILKVADGWVVIFKGDSAPKRAGDRVQGAVITNIDDAGVTLEFSGEHRRIPKPLR
jgi:hypothetical protein